MSTPVAIKDIYLHVDADRHNLAASLQGAALTHAQIVAAHNALTTMMLSLRDRLTKLERQVATLQDGGTEAE